jgi:NAD(P)H-flavin reductase
VNFAAAADPFIPLPYRVRRARRETREVTTLELVPLAGEAPGFLPGQFCMLYVFGVGEVAISVSGDPAEPGVMVHTVRDVGAVSGAITRLRAGAVIGVRGPFGTAWPTEAARGNNVVIAAGGLGLAPLRPVIYELLAHRDRYGRIVVLYGTRSPEHILFRHEFERWRRHLDVDITITVDYADPAWRGNVGVLPKLIPRISFDPDHTIAMVCGPEIMMRFTVSALQEAGLGLDHMHVSMERNMKCAIGLCGHCQFGPSFVCKDGPVMRYDRIASLLAVREI